MEIEILKIIDEFYVHVNYERGTFIGKWMGSDIPQNGKYCVEIDYNTILSYEILNERNYYIKNINGKNIIYGFIIDEGIEDDFVQFLDIIGDGIIKNKTMEDNTIENYINGECIIMVNIKENNLKNKFIKLELDEIQLYPINY
jgi:hypothetical protein